MKNQLFTVAALGFGLVVNCLPSHAGDPYFPADPGPRYQYDDREGYGGSGSLKDAPFYTERHAKRNNHARYYGEQANYCLPRQHIRRKLRNAGYYDIRRKKVRPHIIKFHAWHDDGCLYRIHVDRCSGAVVRSRVLSRGGAPRSYAQPYGGRYQNGYGRRPYRRDYRYY